MHSDIKLLYRLDSEFNYKEIKKRILNNHILILDLPGDIWGVFYLFKIVKIIIIK